VNLSEGLKEENVQIHVSQQQESKHFLSLFKPFIVHSGKYNDYKNIHEEVIEVRESNIGNIRAIGIKNEKIIAHSNSLFLYKVNDSIFINAGLNSTSNELEYSKKLSKLIYPTLKVNQSSDPNKMMKNFKVEEIEILSRNQTKLFHFYSQSGVVEFTEIKDFSQSHLLKTDVFLLHDGNTIYCWFGEKSNFYTRKFTLELAEKYQKKVEAESLFVVKSNLEPIEFTSSFQAWEYLTQTNERKTFNYKKILEEYQRTTYTYSQLLDETLPEGVDATKLEVINELFNNVLSLI
jgi:hypothetical protein